MKRFFTLFVSTCSVLMITGCIPALQRIQDPLSSDEAAVANFRPVEPVQWKLPNGLTVMHLEDRELPLVSGRLFLRGGALWSPEDRIGVATAMGDQMRQGGAGRRGPEELDRELERLAATVSSNFGAEFGSVSFQCLRDDLPKVFEIFRDVALRPRFDRERLQIWKGQALDAIRRRVEDPGTVAALAYQQIIYAGTPYGRVSTEKDIHRIEFSQLAALHRELVRPDGAILVLTGNLSREEAEQFAADWFGGWQERGAELPPAPPVPNEPLPGVYLVELPLAQSTVQMGHLGVPRLTPDYPAIDVFNEVFGASGFGSRLMKRIRTELGLSYGTFGAISPGTVRGTNSIFLQTKAESTGEAVVEAMKVLQEMQTFPSPVRDVEERKASIEKSFIFNFASPDAVLGRRAQMELLRYPADYDATYLGKIAAVDVEDIQQVAQVRWDLKKFVIVVVGNSQALRLVEQKILREPELFKGMPVIRAGFDTRLQLPG
jgi:zinc protease